ncbi:COPI associated protein-domain-containing protein [Pavlovales sp. CCMP2436]|nr:COPI associated protein-domain-containing protein [Pavlovales sp. CCMP2436]|mmetsp:Transcript_43335/g.107049  ORF Transcript_43335/g.107049 Transcript_43335/m.107049 type:complete len:194 (-) Transcript_43335:114-695(-)
MSYAPTQAQLRGALSTLGVMTGIAIVSLSLFIFITHSWRGIQGFITRLWNMIFGILIILSEIDLDASRSALSYLSFLTTDFGRGLFFIFVGTMVLANEWWEILIACFSLLCGCLHITSTMMCAKPDSSAVPKPEAPPKRGSGTTTGPNPFNGGGGGADIEVPPASTGGGYDSNYGAAATPSDNPFSRPPEQRI